MPDATTALVLGVHSFAEPHRKTGIQYIAEGLARHGLRVDYVSAPSSPLDAFGAERRRRLARVWPRAGRSPLLTPMPGLSEYAFPALLPAHASLLRSTSLLAAVQRPAAAHFNARSYDLCVHDVGPTMAYLPLVRAKRYFLRLNDAPQTLPGLPPILARMLGQRLRDGQYRHVWAVSEPLAAWAEGLAPATPVSCIPNGYDAPLFAGHASRLDGCRAVYAGGRTPWLDMDLLRQTARLLPHWEIHCLGPGFGSGRDAANLRFLPPVAHREVPALLAGYDVGLLPYADAPHMAWVRCPLKYYEYVAAGLGVACADVGGLREGMGEWVRFGDSPETFARAVEDAAEAMRAAPADGRAAFLADNSWDARLAQMLETASVPDQPAPAAS